ncbi:bifunctional [glutamate--ammonia ligase]-adenylyl-L-tyrosine phosphorylase/[glutamate--ammonia-ligase] adenylyltransferase [Desulfobacula sp.]|uniref:bifunctional [glutamate--ammonia ligase]-adenylyl-L-tyrosine phosphorylase/[glutamate--ammonia-ligase] adenylyltransferase n=1 Tax=Desulfobacula sp. TaxID=2593537 RepID=UPI0025BC0539|nr:bifunctional [glutamate--ammonia ligase]-adenylyl-L-tyrosine phosphorylase/[glutamate--ammonia-ligase] adenylyltransferase [Desulfobacula sp.]MBC2704149.1 bifunctional [glutamate--ammonia ligase]-adenylyl-L-tyrosine phosphorylase/[glutamate--ammonia-ligase] adenylyltransferase [Desulfobacula sp.]
MDHSLINKVFPDLDKNLLITVKNRVDSFTESLKRDGLQIALDTDLKSDLIKIFLFSEFIAASFTKNPGIFKDLIDSKDLFKSYSEYTVVARLEKKISKDMDVATVKEILLQTKLYETIRIAWRDLTGKAKLSETLFDLSTLADAIVDMAIKVIYDEVCESYGLPVDSEGNFQGMIVLGMGKLGAKELNFSSDIDLIFVYPKEGYTNGENIISNEAFFTKVCRRFLRFFSPGSHGINFYRIDTRLRPYGDGGPLVMSSFVFEAYYQAQGREWERYAMIKARPVAGDIEAGFKLLKVLNSFIYRRYFDYGSFDSFRDMKHRITLQVKNKKLKNNIKLGAGGIREIEFFGQLFQLIRGGVEPKLQEQKILKVLDLLESHSCINEATKKDLKESYVFLRMVENRLQAYADLQTHDIPEKEDQRKVLALSMGVDAWDDFAKNLNDHMQRVHYHFSQLLVSEEQEKPDKEMLDLKELWVNINDPQFTPDSIAIGRFKEPDRVLSILRFLEEHPNTKRLTSNGRKKLARLIPVLVRKIGEQNDPDAVLVKLIDLIITIERRTCYLSLLIENKRALGTLITLAQKSPWIITFLSKHPALLDELMHPATLYFPPGKQALEKEMETRMEGIPSGDLEFLLEELCVFKQINYLRVSAADVSGNYPLMKVSDHLTYIAETVLSQVLLSAWDIVTQKYGFPDGISDKNPEHCGFAVIVYGKVGGLEMGYKSDIDIVFLYKADSGVTKGRLKSIDTIRFYSNLGQRIINALTMHTPAGILYGADMRLRPGGNSGMIVSHIDAFEDYMKNQAWTWEHQALIRARPVAGDKALCSRFNEIRKAVLIEKRDAKALKKEVGEMRERMREEHLKYKKDFFDLKQSRGCIVDIEFLVQYLILKNAHTCPDITIWTDNIRLLESLDAEGIITGFESERLQKAYLIMRKAVHRLNLQEKSLAISQTQFSEIREHVIDMYDQYLADRKD